MAKEPHLPYVYILYIHNLSYENVLNALSNIIYNAYSSELGYKFQHRKNILYATTITSSLLHTHTHTHTQGRWGSLAMVRQPV